MILVRIVYFLLVGWWAGLIWGLAAYVLCATWVFLPLGTVMFNRLPFVVSLDRGIHSPFTSRSAGDLPFLIRVIWFFVVGWWLGLLAFKVGYLLCATIVLVPFGVWLLHRVPLAMTLKHAA